MSTIFGIGVPSKIKPHGTNYVDRRSGIKYVQNTSPVGNNWTIPDVNVADDSSPSSFEGFSNVLYHITKELTYDDILSSVDNAVLIGPVPTNDNYALLVTGTFILYSGTSITLSTQPRILTSENDSVAVFNRTCMTSYDPIDIVPGYLSASIRRPLTTDGMNLYFSLNNVSVTGGDNTSWAKIFITYLIF